MLRTSECCPQRKHSRERTVLSTYKVEIQKLLEQEFIVEIKTGRP